MAHFVEDMRGKLSEVGVFVIVGVGKRNRDDLFVVSAVIYHRNRADRVRSAKRERFQCLRAEEKYVQRVSVVAVSSRDKSVIHRIMR